MLQRTINNINIAINPYSSNEIYLDSEFLEKNCTLKENKLSPPDVCRLIVGNSYIPMLLTWELLDTCNFSCPFCYIMGHSHNDHIRFANIKPEIHTLIDLGLLYCTLTGGEVLLHKDFKKIYSFLKLSGVLVSIYTNGYLIDDEIIKLFRTLPPYKIEISIYGVDQITFDKTTKTRGLNYKKVLDNIIKLRDSGFNIRCKTPFNSITEDGFSKIGNWCKSNKIDYYYSTTIFQAYDGESLDCFQPNFSSMVHYEAEKIKMTKKNFPNIFDKNKQNITKECFTCGAKNYGFHINSNFNLFPCQRMILKECSFPIASLGIIKSLSLLKEFINTQANKPILGCNGCIASNTCKMCPAIALPNYNKKNNIESFSVPWGHCEFEKKRYYGLLNELSSKY